MVPLDGSRAARAALPVARVLARMDGAGLHLLYACDAAISPPEAARRLAVEPGERVVVETGHGDPSEVILAAARRHAARLLVMSTHCGHPRAGLGLGSVAEAVLRRWEGPLVLVNPARGEVDWTPKALLLPLDGSPGSAAAVDHASRVAQASGARLALLHVACAGAAGERETGTYAAPFYEDHPQHEWPAWHEEFLSRSTGSGAREGVALKLTCGPAGAAIVRAAAEEQADLVVLAWHGVLDEVHAGTLRAVLSGVTCPVLVLRAGGES